MYLIHAYDTRAYNTKTMRKVFKRYPADVERWIDEYLTINPDGKAIVHETRKIRLRSHRRLVKLYYRTIRGVDEP